MSSVPPPPSLQELLNHFITGPSFTITLPACLGVYHYLFNHADPLWLGSMETRGDARVASDLAYVQTMRFAGIPHKVHSRMKHDVLSNYTFQRFVAGVGADPGNVANFSKSVANAFEIFVEAYAQIAGDEAAAQWHEELFVPIIQALIDGEPMGPRKKVCVASLRAAKPPNSKAALKAKRNKATRDAARLSRRGQENRAPATNSPATTSALPSRPFTFGL
ncbi:hypothetical protein C8R46DRAFT_513862 [Mycena filopes]|nr:hypothetical protein C8R46DRAFT_513862 [Mycena filopes]